jgi:RNA polymerase sigma factor (sigma-70 family)
LYPAFSFYSEAQVGEKSVVTGQECDTSGNIQRAAVIFFEHGDFIRTVIRRKVHDESRVEDLFQDFFLSLATRPIPPDVRNIRSFIYKALINDITDRHRSFERRNNLTYNYANFYSKAINNCSVEDAIIEKEQTEKMIELLRKRATKNEAKAIALRYCDNLCVGDVADRMGINKRSVSSYISAGLRKVRQFLVLEQGD